jgi:hypothetical protein
MDNRKFRFNRSIGGGYWRMQPSLCLTPLFLMHRPVRSAGTASSLNPLPEKMQCLSRLGGNSHQIWVAFYLFF